MAIWSHGFLFLFLSGILAYEQGPPGARWSVATQKAVKAKLYRIFSPHQSLALYKDLHPDADESTETSVTVDGIKQKWESMPNSAKVLRLGFHGCFPKTNVDGEVEAACNGCINTRGMNIRFDHDKSGDCSQDTSHVSHHNGLGPTLEILEEIYKNSTFPPRTPKLEISLNEMGISRADLWAFATISAIEYGIDMNNIMCQNPNHLSALDVDNYAYNSGTSSSHYHYNIHFGEAECEIEKQHFRFTTGRSDCRPPGEDSGLPAYHTDREEIAPNGQGNGEATVKYFKDNFGFTGQETVAILGSHTLGVFNYPHTAMHYTWTSRGIELFNNDYYKILALEDSYIFNAYSDKYGDIPIKPVGDAYNAPAKTRWRARVRNDDITCGPAFWRHDYLTCPDCHVPEGVKPHLAPDDDKSCCVNKPDQAYCTPNERGDNGIPKDQKGGCEVWRFSKDPEVALNAEIGLVLKFEVDENGYPTGCDGLENFKYIEGESEKKSKSTVPTCKPQDLREPVDDEKTVLQYVQDYAQDRALWFKDYAAVLPKMLSNGYLPGTLKDNSPSLAITCATPTIAPIFPRNANPALDTRCPQWKCWGEGEDKKFDQTGAFQLSSDDSSSVLTSGKDGPQLDSTRSVCTASQIWKLVRDQIVNEKTGQPLEVDGASSWIWEEDVDGQFLIKAIMAGNSKKKYLRKKGVNVGLGKKFSWTKTEI